VHDRPGRAFSAADPHRRLFRAKICASSGVGAAIAKRLSRPQAKLILQGRNEARLEEVAGACRRSGAAVETYGGDLSDKTILLQLAADLVNHPIDEAYLCAGIGDMRAPGRKVESIDSTFAVANLNFTATATLATALADAMVTRGGGQIVMIGSVAGAFALAMAPSYSASKAGLRIFAEALGDGLTAEGVGVTHIVLGFVDTPMSQRLDCWKPGMLTPEAAAARIIDAARAKRRSVAIPAWFGAAIWIGGLMPAALRRQIFANLDVAQSSPG
jgi:short-subunit dehydrogenase